MIETIMDKLGFVRCRVCNKWTKPSIIVGNMCSWECYRVGQKDTRKPFIIKIMKGDMTMHYSITETMYKCMNDKKPLATQFLDGLREVFEKEKKGKKL